MEPLLKELDKGFEVDGIGVARFQPLDSRTRSVRTGRRWSCSTVKARSLHTSGMLTSSDRSR